MKTPNYTKIETALLNTDINETATLIDTLHEMSVSAYNKSLRRERMLNKAKAKARAIQYEPQFNGMM